MKRVFLIGVLALALIVNTASAQGISQSQVPSLVVNSFQQAFPKAADVEWELNGENYKVEFETGLHGKDHDAWYDKSGKLMRHKEEISQSDLPEKILAKTKSDFSTYRVDDVTKIMEGTKVTYNLELKSLVEKWKVTFDSEGIVLNKIAD